MYNFKHILFGMIAILSNSYAQTTEAPSFDNQAFSDYWYQGKAELTSYTLEQARYGEIHKGEAVLIFVTENFLEDRQVKQEYGQSENAVTVLKLNSYRHFYTGIYPYSLLTSTFSPISHQSQPPLKVSASTQEWCGHVYTQLNLRDSQYQVRSHSYFQREGDQEFNIQSDLLEDQLWNQIRMSPASLPVGNIELVPSVQHLRMVHKAVKSYPAQASLVNVQKDGQNLFEYKIAYSNLDRIVTILFDADSPFRILGWTEVVRSGFGNAGTLTTKASLKKSMKTPYWQQNSVADSTARHALGLE